MSRARCAGALDRLIAHLGPDALVLGIVLLGGCAPAPPGTVVSVHDGDTVSVRREHDTVRVRLACVDAPERGQPFATRARRELEALVLGRQVRLDVIDRDRYGRLVARLVDGTTDINLAMVERGLAWHYRHHCPDDTVLARAEAEARRARRGLWHDRDPLPPWQFRRR